MKRVRPNGKISDKLKALTKQPFVIPAPRPVGRPSKYRPEFAAQAEAMCKLGATDAELASHFNCTTNTIASWRCYFEEFDRALKVGKDAFDDRVERSLAQRAVGYAFDTEHTKVTAKGKVIKYIVRSYIPPDVVACFFWLKNRRPEQWRDKQHHEMTGKDNGPIEHTAVDTLTSRIASIASRTGTGPDPTRLN